MRETVVKVNKIKPLISLFVVGFIISYSFFYYIWPPKDYSKTPQEVIQKLATAVSEENKHQLLALFESRTAYQEFMKSPLISISPEPYPVAMTASDRRSRLKRWKRWFEQYGISHVKYYTNDPDDLVRCAPPWYSFVIVVKPTAYGFIIQTCGYLAI